MSEFRERFIQSGDVQIHAVESGPETGEPVLFLHGFPEFWYSWRHQLRAVADAGFRGVAIDQRGFGDSSKPTDVEEYSMGRLLGDVDAVVEDLGGRVSVACHDWGGAVGWLYATFYAAKVARLFVCNVPHPIAFTRGLRSPAQFDASLYMLFFERVGLAEEILARNNFEYFTHWAYGTATQALSESDLERYLEQFRKPGALTGGLNWYRANPVSAALVGDLPQIPPVEVDTRVVWGVDDPYLLEATGRDSAEFCSGGFDFHPVPDAGHWVMQEQPEMVNEKLLEFLTR